MSKESRDIQVNTVSKSEASSYRSIFKATSLFGGVQVWKILITIIQTKFVAILLGPSGMGIKGLYTSAISLIQSITAMGLSNSAVRDVSEAHGTGNAFRVSRTVKVLRKLVWLTGLLGMFSVIVLSPILSKTTFGDYSYIIPFIILSVTLLLHQLTSGQNVILQGTRKLKFLAKAGVIGSLLSLVITVPFYYLWGIKGIVPTMVLEALLLFALAYYYAKKVKTLPVKVSLKDAVREGKGMMSLGMVMTYNSMLVLGCSYIIKIYITRHGGVSDVGLYNAGFAVVNTYVNLIFSAMTTDFYPRLAAVNQDNTKSCQVINQQLEIALLILLPMMMLFLIIAPWAVIALYSQKFLPITGYMKWAIMGIVFKALSWAISYQFVAKGDKKAFALNETIINCIAIVMNIIGYSLWGITGLGISFVVVFVIYTLIVYYVAHKKYEFSLSYNVIKTVVAILMCLVPVFLMMTLWQSRWQYVPSFIILLLGSWYSFRELDKKMNFKSLLSKIRKNEKR